MGTAGRTTKLKFSDPVRVVRIDQLREWNTEGAYQGFGRFGGFGVEDLESKDGVLELEVNGEGESLVPNRARRSRVVRFGGKSPLRIKPENNVRLEIAVTPVYVLKVLCRDDSDIEIK